MTVTLPLPELLKVLRENRVSRFSDTSVTVQFWPDEPKPTVEFKPELPPGAPPELKDPDLMSEDAIRNWSAPGGPGGDTQEPLPMTGDEP